MVATNIRWGTRLGTLDQFSVIWANRDVWDGQGIFNEAELVLDIPAQPTPLPDTTYTTPAEQAIEEQLKSPDIIPEPAAEYSTSPDDYREEQDNKQAIINAIRMRLLTYRGTREYSPFYGTDLVDCIGLPLDITLRQRVVEKIRTELIKDADWYTIVTITTRLDANDPRILHAEIVVREVSTGIVINYELRVI